MYKKIFVYTNTNCRRRLLDTKKLKLYFQKNNFSLVDDPQNADLIVYVTCAYRNEITDSCLKKIQEFQEFNAKLIVAGCLPEIEKDKLKDIFGGDTISTKNLNGIDKYFPKNSVKFSDINDADAIFQQPKGGFGKQNFEKKSLISKIKSSTIEFVIKNFLNEHLMIYLFPDKSEFYHVRISWGCRGKCSYCGIKKAIGPLKSKPLNGCLNDFKKGVEKGYKKIVITADDVGAYGLDIGSNFPELLLKLLSIPGDYTISVQDFDPKWAVKYVDELEEIFKDKKITSINIALQSGCERILKLMNRYSDIEKVEDALKRLKKSNYKMSFDTHFILGFPTESHEDFTETINFVNRIGFDMGFIYRFSCKTGTKAEKIKPKLTSKEVVERLGNTRKILKNNGYKVITLSKNSFYTFYKK